MHDHTSILKFIETKWNLGALTYRDANADDLLDTLDLRGPPAFAEPPALLAAAGATGTCTPGNPGGPIPPPSSGRAGARGVLAPDRRNGVAWPHVAG